MAGDRLDAAAGKGPGEEQHRRQERHPERVGNRIARYARADAVDKGVAGDDAGVEEGEHDRVFSALSGLEGERQHADRDCQNAEHRTEGKLFADQRAAGGRDDQGRSTAHQRIDKTDIASAIGGGDELEIGELEQGRNQDVGPGFRLRQGQEWQEGDGHGGGPERDHCCVERFFRACLDQGIPGRVQQRPEQDERNDFKRQDGTSETMWRAW
ncbi:hypothetical protein D9M70_522470 [compost metagenome]